MATTPTPDDIMGLLQGVIDPELGSNIVELGMAKSASISPDGEVVVDIDLTIAGCPLKSQIQSDVSVRIEAAPGVSGVTINWGVLSAEEKSATMAVARRNAAERSAVTAISPTTKVVLVASGKGGVGKSSVTVNLAAGLADRGFTVGVVDADIGGFSLPRMLGIEGRLVGAARPSEASTGTDSPDSSGLPDAPDTPDTPESAEEPEPTAAGESTDAPSASQMIPNERKIGDGTLRVVSMGFLTDSEETALAWRGATLGRAVQHFIEDVRWGDLDYLLIDTPPGTGDIQMGLARMLPRAEMIVVTTPAVSAQKVASRAVDLARKHFLRVVGVVENMSAFVCEHGETYALFGEGGGAALAADSGIPLLGSIPLDATVAKGSDTGAPVVLGSGPGADAFNTLVDHVVTQAIPPVDLASCTARLLTDVDGAIADTPVAFPSKTSPDTRSTPADPTESDPPGAEH